MDFHPGSGPSGDGPSGSMVGGVNLTSLAVMLGGGRGRPLSRVPGQWNLILFEPAMPGGRPFLVPSQVILYTFGKVPGP
jgi:hypothetical protein